MPEASGVAEAVVLVKASPQVSQKHGETVCCAGVTLEGKWVRLYPVTFRKLEDAQQFKRWDLIRYKWRRSKDDHRPESYRVEQESIEVVGNLAKRDRPNLLSRLEVTGLNAIAAEGKSLALLRPQQPKFLIAPKAADEIAQERLDYASIGKQRDMFNTRVLVPLEPCPVSFKYRYRTDDGEREGTCQDWETDATFFNWRHQYGEAKALREMERVFGEEYPAKGMTFAMGTHSRYPDVWLINGLIRVDEVTQMMLL